MTMKKTITLFAGAACACLLAGCANTQQARLYVLHSPESDASVQASDDSLSDATVIIERIRMPKHLDRPAILTRATDSELAYSEFRRWAGPLDDELTRAISMDLSKILGSSSIGGYRSMLNNDYDYRVDIEIMSMTGVIDKDASLVARWQVADDSGLADHVKMRTTSYREDLPKKSGYDAFVDAQSRMVMDLSGDIATELRRLAKQPKKTVKK